MPGRRLCFFRRAFECRAGRRIDGRHAGGEPLGLLGLRLEPGSLLLRLGLHRIGECLVGLGERIGGLLLRWCGCLLPLLHLLLSLG